MDTIFPCSSTTTKSYHELLKETFENLQGFLSIRNDKLTMVRVN